MTGATTGRLSIIVPMYNTADYLTVCLESIAQQTFGDFEVVMVDDGSPDNSAELARAFASKDPRFRLVQQENQGLGAARNTGAAHARGELIAFVDSDDVLPAHAYEVLVSTIERSGSDIASGYVRRFNSVGSKRLGFLDAAFRQTVRALRRR